MKKYILIVMLFSALISVTASIHAKPSAPINVNYHVIKIVSIDETISHELSVFSNIDLAKLSVILSPQSGLTLDESSMQSFTNINAGENTAVLFNATYTNNVGYVIVDITATDVNGDVHYKNKVIKYGTGSALVEKFSAVTSVNDEKVILMPAQVQPLK